MTGGARNAGARRGPPAATAAFWVLVQVLAAGAAAQETRPAGPGETAGTTRPAPTLALSLEEAVELALRNNLELRSAWLEEQVLRARIMQALGEFDPALFAELSGGRQESLFAGSFPVDPSDPTSGTVTRILSARHDRMNLAMGVRGLLETGMSYELTFTTDYDFDQQGSEINPIFTNSTRLTFTQPLLRSAWPDYQLAPVRLARIGTRRAHQTYRGVERDKIKEIQEVYFELVFAKADLEVKRRSLELAERQVALTRVQVETGTLPRVEITAAESARAGRQAEVVTAQAAVVAAEDRLRRLILGFDDESDWELRLVPTEGAEVEQPQLLELQEILARAEAVEPSLLEARLAVEEAEVAVQQRSREALPRLDLGGSVAAVGLDEDAIRGHRLAFEREGALSWNLELGFEYPLGNRAAEARVAEAELALRQARVDLRNARIELAFQVRRTLRDIRVARRSIEARGEAVRLAAEQLQNERVRLELRTTTNFQVFQVEEQLSQRRSERIQAQIDYRLALLELVRVTSLPLGLLVEEE